MEKRQKENIVMEIEELTGRTLLNYPSYFMCRKDEIDEANDEERVDILNEIYFEYLCSEGGELLELIDSIISGEYYHTTDGVKRALNEFKEDILTLEIQDDIHYYLDDVYEEILNQLKKNIFNTRYKRNIALDVIKHYRANKHSMDRCDDIINSYKERL